MSGHFTKDTYTGREGSEGGGRTEEGGKEDFPVKAEGGCCEIMLRIWLHSCSFEERAGLSMCNHEESHTAMLTFLNRGWYHRECVNMI